MKKTATFVSKGELLLGRDAVEAFEAQPARCACGCGSDGERISGTASDMPAEWLECSTCTGQAIGYPLVHRTQSQIAAKRQQLSKSLAH